MTIESTYWCALDRSKALFYDVDSVSILWPTVCCALCREPLTAYLDSSVRDRTIIWTICACREHGGLHPYATTFKFHAEVLLAHPQRFAGKTFWLYPDDESLYSFGEESVECFTP